MIRNCSYYRIKSNSIIFYLYKKNVLGLNTKNYEFVKKVPLLKLSTGLVEKYCGFCKLVLPL